MTCKIRRCSKNLLETACLPEYTQAGVEKDNAFHVREESFGKLFHANSLITKGCLRQTAEVC